MAQTNNEKYVKRGSGLFIDYDPDWAEELAKINLGKNGAPFLYADGLIMMCAFLRTAFRMPYRQLAGMTSRMLDGHDSPAYNTIYRRIQKIDVKIDNNIVTIHDKSKRMTLIADATGLKLHNRGEWLREQWKVRRGFLKEHIMINADNLKVVAVVITDDRKGDGGQLKNLIGQVTGSSEMEDACKADGSSKEDAPKADGKPAAPKPEAKAEDELETSDNKLAAGIPPIGQRVRRRAAAVMYADGAYGSRENIKMLDDLDIITNIKVNINSTALGKGSGDAWGLLVRRQLGGGPEEKIGDLPTEERLENRLYWRCTVGYNERWLVEIVISALKRMFGESVMSLKWDNMVREVKLRIALYNKWIDEAAAM